MIQTQTISPIKILSIRQKTCFVLLLCALFFSLPLITTAQVSDLTPDITLSTSPAEPKPLESVVISAKSFSVDLNQSTMVWQYNGKTVSSGIGRTSVTVFAPASGSVALVSLSVQAPGKAAITNTLLLRPASIDLLWEAADAYTPPFFKGKALVPVSGSIRVSAIPSATAPSGISYNWSRGGSVVAENSGYRKSSYIFLHNILNSQEEISVQATAGGFTGTGKITITPRQPTLLAYEKIEGFTDYTHAHSTTIPVSGTGAVVVFEPYNFSAKKGIANALSFDFSIDGASTLGTGQGNELRFSKAAGSSTATIAASVETVLYSLQNLRRTFNLSFN